MGDRPAAERACKDPNPIIDGRKANVNLAILGAKPRGNLQPGMCFILRNTLNITSKNWSKLCTHFNADILAKKFRWFYLIFFSRKLRSLNFSLVFVTDESSDMEIGRFNSLTRPFDSARTQSELILICPPETSPKNESRRTAWNCAIEKADHYLFTARKSGPFVCSL